MLYFFINVFSGSVGRLPFRLHFARRYASLSLPDDLRTRKWIKTSRRSWLWLDYLAADDVIGQYDSHFRAFMQAFRGLLDRHTFFGQCHPKISTLKLIILIRRLQNTSLSFPQFACQPAKRRLQKLPSTWSHYQLRPSLSKVIISFTGDRNSLTSRLATLFNRCALIRMRKKMAANEKIMLFHLTAFLH